MSVAGILDAMRSDRPLSQRLVWQCLENHANGARFWAISICDMAGELHLRPATIVDAVKALEADGIIRADRRRRCVSVYYMLRTYPPADEIRNPEPDAPATPESGIEQPEVHTENRYPTADLDSDNGQVDNPPSKNPPEKEKESSGHVEKSNAEPELFPADYGALVVQPKPRLPAAALADVPNAWNAVAASHNLPTIRLMTPARERSLAARVAEVGIDGMLAAIQAVGASAFCCGDNDTGWRADFDFLLQPKSLIRVIEGRYANRDRRGGLKLGAIDQLRRDWDLPTFCAPVFEPEIEASLP
jgi:hypothetical protein